MAQIMLNSAVAILIAAAFLITTIAALHNSEDRSLQRVPVKAKTRRHPNG